MALPFPFSPAPAPRLPVSGQCQGHPQRGLCEAVPVPRAARWQGRPRGTSFGGNKRGGRLLWSPPKRTPTPRHPTPFAPSAFGTLFQAGTQLLPPKQLAQRQPPPGWEKVPHRGRWLGLGTAEVHLRGCHTYTAPEHGQEQLWTCVFVCACMCVRACKHYAYFAIALPGKDLSTSLSLEGVY